MKNNPKKHILILTFATLFLGASFAENPEGLQRENSEEEPTVYEAISIDIPPKPNAKVEFLPADEDGATIDGTDTKTGTSTTDDSKETESTETTEEGTKIIRDTMAKLWFQSNICVIFDKYPYYDGPYLTFDNSLADNPTAAKDEGDKTYRFAADTSIFYSPNFGAGNSTRIEGFVFKFIGPYVELNSYIPLNTKVLSTEKIYQGNIRLGLELALYQSNWISWIFTCQWSHYFNVPAIPDGWIFGFILRTYPYKFAPWLAEWRINMGSFNDIVSYAMIESHLEIGAMLFNSAFEVFGAWNWQYKTLLNYEGHGFEAGVRFHF